MKKLTKAFLLVTLFTGMTIPAWGQATPSTEGQDFWVTFLRAADDQPTELKLTISAREGCDVLIENTNTGYSKTQTVTDNSSTELIIGRANCYSSTDGTATYTALHVTATKDISLFAGNYRDKSFDATNVLPTTALLDDYLIQTYPPSDHEDSPQGSHFAIIAVEDGETVVDYNLTAKTTKENIGAHSVTLKKGQVWYVWTGLTKDDPADLSGTTVKARNGKKIAIFQGCPHTNIPDHVRDRDHIVSQAMPIAYWGSEFGITASRMHRRDIVSVMALNDGTDVYINNEDGDKILVHTFDFSKDKKHYWTFEIGEELAYCADNEGQSPSHGRLPEPLVVDSSCYLTTSCPAGVHLFMVSNRYDNAVERVSADTLVSDPAMLWISPIEQVIKEINFATYNTQQAKFHFMNIVTPTANTGQMVWTDENGTQHNIRSYFHPITGNPDYSFARIEIKHGSHNLKGDMGFLAHVYGYGQRESYAYSCGSSTIQRSITFNGTPLLIDSIYSGKFCVNEDIEMKLNIGNNEYQSLVWDYGDGVSFVADNNMSNDEKKITHHTYTTPGWYDLRVSAEYINPCTGKKHDEEMRFSFLVVRADTILVDPQPKKCLTLQEQADTIREKGQAYLDDLVANGRKEILNPDAPCYETRLLSFQEYGLMTDSVRPLETLTERDSLFLNGRWWKPDDVDFPRDSVVIWVESGKNQYGCDSTCTISYKLNILQCLEMSIPQLDYHICPGETFYLPYIVTKGNPGEMHYICGTTNVELDPLREKKEVELPTDQMKPGAYKARITVQDDICDTLLNFPIDLMVYYPSTIFKYKFNNVLAVYNKDYNGGYEFTGYQWYVNGEAIPGANSSIYHTDDPFNIGDVYYVVLTRADGVTLPSCSQTITRNDVPNVESGQAPAVRKSLINNRLYIYIEDRVYDSHGQRVK